MTQLKRIWNEMKSRLRQTIAQLTDDNRLFEESREEEALMRLQQSFGESRENGRHVTSDR